MVRKLFRHKLCPLSTTTQLLVSVLRLLEVCFKLFQSLLEARNETVVMKPEELLFGTKIYGILGFTDGDISS